MVKDLKLARRFALRAARSVKDEGPISERILKYVGPEPSDSFRAAGLNLRGHEVVFTTNAKRWARDAALDIFVQFMNDRGHKGFQCENT